MITIVCYLYGSSQNELVGRLLPAPSESKQSNANHRSHIDKEQGWSGSRELQLKQVESVIQTFQRLLTILNW